MFGDAAIPRADAALLGWLQRHATPTGTVVADTVTRLGSPTTMMILGMVVAVGLARRRRWLLLGGWLAAFIGGLVLDLALKGAVHRPRPPDADLFLRGTSWSFPSGHAMGALIGCGMLGYLLIVYAVTTRRARWAVVVAAALVVLAVGLSRLYLGVHYLSDVLAGYAAGTLWLAACISGLEVARRWPRPSPARPEPSGAPTG